MRRTAEDALATRELILDTALEQFSQFGYSETRMEDIAQTADITRGAIYHHFDSKENLYRTLITERSENINSLVEAIVNAGDSPLETLRRLFTALLSYVEREPEYRALLQMVIKTGMGSAERSVMEQTRLGRRSLADYLSDLFREGINNGEFRDDLDAEVAALNTMGFLNGIGLLWVQDPEWFSIANKAELMTETHLRGLRS